MADIYWPFDPSTVSEWPGTRPAGWSDHVGTDFAVPQGTPLKATMAGTVEIHWTDGLGAWVIDIINPDGTVVRNGHLSYMAVADGEWVNAGDYIGNTGGALGTPGAGLSTGSHLHWELRNNTDWGAWGWYDPRNLNIKTFGVPAPDSGATIDVAELEDEDMAKNSGIYYKTAAGVHMYGVVNTASGYYHEVSGNGKNPLSPDYLKRQVAAFDLANGGFFLISEGEAKMVKAAAAAVRTSK